MTLSCFEQNFLILDLLFLLIWIFSLKFSNNFVLFQWCVLVDSNGSEGREDNDSKWWRWNSITVITWRREQSSSPFFVSSLVEESTLLFGFTFWGRNHPLTLSVILHSTFSFSFFSVDFIQLYSTISLIIHFSWLFVWGIVISTISTIVFGVGVIYCSTFSTSYTHILSFCFSFHYWQKECSLFLLEHGHHQSSIHSRRFSEILHCDDLFLMCSYCTYILSKSPSEDPLPSTFYLLLDIHRDSFLNLLPSELFQMNTNVCCSWCRLLILTGLRFQLIAIPILWDVITLWKIVYELVATSQILTLWMEKIPVFSHNYKPTTTLYLK